MNKKPYGLEVISRKEKLRHQGNFIFYEETVIDHRGIERLYGYNGEGRKYLLNVGYVIEKTREMEKSGEKNIAV